MSSRVYESIIKVGATISKAFSTDTKNAAESLKKLSEQTKKLKDAEKAAASYKKLDDAVSKSKAKYDQASAALHRLQAAERAAGESTKESTKWRKAGERAVAKAAREMDRATKSAEKNAKALREMGVDTAKLAKEQERLAKTLAATERQEKSLERFEKSRERLFGKKREHEPLFKKAGEQVKGIGESVLHLAEGALVAGEAMHLLVDHTIHAGSEIGETAEKLGIGAKALQELRYGASQSGAEVGSLDIALRRMAVSVGHFKAKKGKGGALEIPGLQSLDKSAAENAAAVNPFKTIGLDAKKLALLKPEEQIKKIADGLSKLKTHSDRAAAAQLIFGKGAAEILPFLAEGSEGIEKLAKNANKYGGVLSGDTVAASIAAEKASKDMNLALGGLTNTLGAALLPVATRTFKEISEWVSKNRADIGKWAQSTAAWVENKAIPAILKFGAEIKALGAKVIGLVSGAANLVGGFHNLAVIVAAMRFAPLIKTLGQIAVKGVDAAAALFKLAAANKAANAVGAGEVGPSVAKSDSLSKYIPVVGTAIAAGLAAQQLEVPGIGGGFTFADLGTGGSGFNDEKFKQLAIDRGAIGGGGGKTEININTPVIVGGGARSDLKSALEKNNEHVLDLYDNDRLSFAR